MPSEAARHAEVMRALGNLEGKLDAHIKSQADTVTRHEAAISTLYSKTNDHDRRFARLRGAATVLGAIGGLITAAFTWLAKIKLGG